MLGAAAALEIRKMAQRLPDRSERSFIGSVEEKRAATLKEAAPKHNQRMSTRRISKGPVSVIGGSDSFP
jgi:hypothetical protein